MQSNGSAMLIHHKMTKKSKIVPQEDDKNCQSKKYYGSMCSDKKCLENINIWPMKPQMEVQLKKPASKPCDKKSIGRASDKNCQATICEYDDFQMCSDKDCQENINMWLPKPAIRRLCSEKNCHSTRCIVNMTRTVNLCKNLNLKELYYHCHMWTAICREQ